VPPSFSDTEIPEPRRFDFDDGEPNLAAYYRRYWEGRGEGFVPMSMGIDEPVQSMSHDKGRLLYRPPPHLAPSPHGDL
jgi:hypothetical protein